MRTFATISPIPGFRRWLSAHGEKLDDGAERSGLAELLPILDRPRWFEDPAICGELQRHLTPLCACYLLHTEGAQEPLDPVSRFHLVNGARLERLNWLADTSAVGLGQSAGMMVNYVYRLGDVERNHEAYARDRTIVASRRLQLLAKQSKQLLSARSGSSATREKQAAAGQGPSTEPLPAQQAPGTRPGRSE